jgi:hypothetical protein
MKHNNMEAMKFMGTSKPTKAYPGPKKNYTCTSYIRLCIIGHHSVALSLTATTTSRIENNNKQRYLNIAANKGSRIIQHLGVQI